MTRIEETVWCDGCGVEIRWVPVVIEDRHYCCQDCTYGYECACEPELDLDNEERRASSLPFT